MFGDEKEREGDDLDVTSDEIEDLDALVPTGRLVAGRFHGLGLEPQGQVWNALLSVTAADAFPAGFS